MAKAFSFSHKGLIGSWRGKQHVLLAHLALLSKNLAAFLCVSESHLFSVRVEGDGHVQQ